MYKPIISIDLGASYTKLTVRECAEPDRLGERHTSPRLLLDRGEALIPSVVIEERGPNPKWFFGVDAAEMYCSGPNRIRHVNWKEQLFKEELDGHSAKAVIVAREFMTWLRNMIEKAGIDHAEYEVCIALPAFQDSARLAHIMTCCMESAGWRSPSIQMTTEPHANAIGLLSNGQNCVTRNRCGDMFLNYGDMYGQDSLYVVEARKAVLWGSKQSLVRLGIIDIGAFTTDIAFVPFATSSLASPLDDGLRGSIHQVSHPLGIIRDMDEPILEKLEQSHGLDHKTLSFMTTEKMKMALYSEESFTFIQPGAERIIELGSKSDLDLINHQAGLFAERVCEQSAAIFGEDIPDVIFLTGGGSLINVIAKHLTNQLMTRLGLKTYQIICDVNSTRPIVEELPTDSESLLLRPWSCREHNLGRFSTALGGASVILQAHRHTHPAAKTEDAVAPRPTSRLGAVPCLCQGGNTQCCYCGGSGIRRVS